MPFIGSPVLDTYGGKALQRPLDRPQGQFLPSLDAPSPSYFFLLRCTLVRVGRVSKLVREES